MPRKKVQIATSEGIEDLTLQQEDIPTRDLAKKIYKNEKQKQTEERKDFVPITNPKLTVEVAVKPKFTRDQIEKIESPAQSDREDEDNEKQGIIITKTDKTKKAKKTTKARISKEDIEKIDEEEKFKPGKIKSLKGNSILIITEKPQAAAKIASSLSNGTDRQYSGDGVSYYEFEKDGEHIIVACAVGHLFSLSQDVKGSNYPIFEVSWKPNYEVRKKDFTKKYYTNLAKLMRRAKEVIIATDYDTEGEVIGYNIIRFIAHQKDAKRMKYSSLTKDELESAFKNASPTIDWGQAIAGETRHFIDWYYGINLSRALMNSIKTTGKFKIMSIGRVQGPALKLIVDKEREIDKFKPVPYFKVFINVKEKKDKTNTLKLKHIKDIFDERELVKFEKLKGEECDVETSKNTQTITPPFPFDLTTLQTEAYRFFSINPARTLSIAQELYLAGIISYPRTSSQKIPEAINPKAILKKLAKAFPKVKLATRNTPTEGKKSDPAHPSISPTGESGSGLEGELKKIYELIVKRFIACFCDDAIVENKTITATAIDSKTNEKLLFKERGAEIRVKGWMEVYSPSIKEKELKDMNGKADILKVEIEKDETKPARRYSPASIISELEKRGLGTKCLTGDTKIISNGEEKKIEEIFEAGKKDLERKNLEIRKIFSKTISLTNNQEVVIARTEKISKRPLKENEEIISIESPSGKIKVTGNHKIYIIENKKIKEVIAKELKIDNKLVALLKSHIDGEILFNKDELKDKYKIKDEDILNKFSSKTAKGIKINSFPIRWSTSLAWVLGYYYGDGSYSNPKYNGSHQIYFTTTEEKALYLLKENIKNIFGNEPYAYDLGRKYKVDCNSMISTVLIKIFPNLKGKKIITIPFDFIGDFLRGFFDADGNVHLRPLGKTKIKGKECNSFNTPRIKITLANKLLINWIKELLKRIGLETKINKGTSICRGKRFDCWTILISGKEKVEEYAYKIGFDSYKEEILFAGLKCASPHYFILRSSARVYLKLIKEEMKPEDISLNLNLSRYGVMRALKHLLNLNLITKKRIGHGSSQKWVYSIKNKNLNYERYSIKLLYPKIAKYIYKLPIEKLSVENYRGDVYDISVGKNYPNFTTTGNILVHNSTRANILETLYDRDYISDNKSIKATPLGVNLIQTLEKHSPIIIDEKLTKDMEKDMDAIRLAKKDLDKKEESVLRKARVALTDISEDFHKKEKSVGEELMKAEQAYWEQQKIENALNECPVCKKGKLAIKFSPRFKRSFIACNAYPECKTTYPLPPGTIKKIDKVCDKCGFPLLMRLTHGKRPWIFCFNKLCPSREEGYAKAKKEDEKDKEENSSAELKVQNEEAEENS